MLVLARQTSQAVVISATVRVTVVAISGDRVRLGVEAPPAVPVDRAEVRARRMGFVDVPFAPASAVCDAALDLGVLAGPSPDDTRY
jgi:carbon storage regulator CsrA